LLNSLNDFLYQVYNLAQIMLFTKRKSGKGGEGNRGREEVRKGVFFGKKLLNKI
jgi:hypothetical protein